VGRDLEADPLCVLPRTVVKTVAKSTCRRRARGDVCFGSVADITALSNSRRFGDDIGDVH
jgi:hypothetical protein